MGMGILEPQDRSLLIEGPVKETLARLTIPMIFGFVSIMLFGAVDTFFVAQLGTDELAAISFTFPVCFTIISVGIGLGVATSSVVSRAIGKGDHDEVKHLATYSLALSMVIVITMATIGLLTIKPLFTMMGAPANLLPLIEDYISIWFMGVGFLVIPMIGNNLVRATGDTKTPSIIMMTSTLINAILDPLLIFGLWGFPRLEMKGAALATVIAWFITLFPSLWILIRREKMLDLSFPKLRHVLHAWKRILHIALPAMGTNVLSPITTGIITALLASYGPKTVAGFGVGSRLEPIVILVIISLSTVLTPFIGQNLGAGKHPRVHEALKACLVFSLLWQGVVSIILVFFSSSLAFLFSDDVTIRGTIQTFLWMIPFSYGFLGVTVLVSAAFNAAHKPMLATCIQLFRLFGLYIPLSFGGSYLFGVSGVFVGLSIGNILSSIVAFLLMRKHFAHD
ncbi:MAG: putative MATE family efflux protein [Chlamydiales bacterium]|jgi:putative MATE family efflux protein